MISWRTDPLWRIFPLLDINWRQVSRAVALGAIALGSAVGLAAASAWLIARASQMPPVLTLSVVVVTVRALGISRGVFRYLERLASHDVALRGMAALRANVYERLARGDSTRLAALRRGELLARVGSDVDSVGDAVVKSFIPIAVAAILSIGSTILVGAFLPGAGIVLAGGLLLAGIMSPWLALRAAKISEARGAQARGEMTAASLDIIESASPLLVSGQMQALQRQLRDADRRLIETQDFTARIAGWSTGILQAATGLSVLGALLLGIPAVTSGSLAAVELSIIVLTPLAAFEAVSALPTAAIQWRRSSHAAQRILDLIGQPTQATAVTPPITASHAALLSLNEVSYTWPGGALPVFSTIQLQVRPGQMIGLVGPSGIGKSTLLMLAAGLLKPDSGTVTVDEQPLAELPASQHVIYAAEDAHIFHTTVLENLRVARANLSEVEAQDVLDSVGLGPWLHALPHALNTMLGADATTISGGERRRLLIARALLTSAPFLLVDEPAEHLDTETADAVLGVLVNAAHAGRGIIIATHRLSALDQADQVILLSQGQDGSAYIQAQGKHAELSELPHYQWALDQEGPTISPEPLR